VESPHIRRCPPRRYTSPGRDAAASGVSGTASGSVSPLLELVLRVGQQPFKLRRVEAEQAHVEAVPLQFLQLDRQKVVVPFGDFGGLVVGDAERLDLLWREVLRDDAGDLGHAQRFGGQHPCVPRHDYLVPVEDDGVAEAELFDGAGHGVHRLLVAARIPLIRADVRDVHHGDLHVSPFGWKNGFLKKADVRGNSAL